MKNLILGLFCALLVTLEVANGRPVTKEEADSLLPDIPKTKNETIAAIVRDEVVQEAVGSVVGNGSLSALVVKKKTLILPVEEPNVVLSQQEDILTAPLSELENIRKNITETTAAINDNENPEVGEVDEVSLAEIVPFAKDFTESGKTPILISRPEILSSGNKIPEKLFTKSVTLTGLIEDKVPEYDAEDDSVAKSAASDSSASNPSPLKLSSESSEENLSNENVAKSGEETLEFGARIPVALVVDTEKSDLRPAVVLESRNVPELETGIEGDSNTSRKNILAIFTNGEEGLYGRTDDNDMIPAEDIIFRPLFRYRQQQNERRRILENRAYQKLGYNWNQNERRRPVYSADNYYDFNYN